MRKSTCLSAVLMLGASFGCATRSNEFAAQGVLFEYVADEANVTISDERPSKIAFLHDAPGPNTVVVEASGSRQHVRRAALVFRSIAQTTYNDKESPSESYNVIVTDGQSSWRLCIASRCWNTSTLIRGLVDELDGLSGLDLAVAVRQQAIAEEYASAGNIEQCISHYNRAISRMDTYFQRQSSVLCEPYDSAIAMVTGIGDKWFYCSKLRLRKQSPAAKDEQDKIVVQCMRETWGDMMASYRIEKRGSTWTFSEISEAQLK